MSRLERSTLQVLEIGRECIERGVHLHVAKNGIVFDNTMQSRIVAVVLGLVAEIERDFISSRTKEALVNRKAEGINKVAIDNPAQSVVNPDEILSCFIACCRRPKTDHVGVNIGSASTHQPSPGVHPAIGHRLAHFHGGRQLPTRG